MKQDRQWSQRKKPDTEISKGYEARDYADLDGILINKDTMSLTMVPPKGWIKI